MQNIWRLVIEVTVPPGDMRLTNGFMNVTTWAASCESARNKIVEYLEGLSWHLVGVEDAHVVTDDEEYTSEELADMIGRTRTNPNAIILGTFHGYLPN